MLDTEKHTVDFNAVVEIESNLDPRAVSSKGAVGLTQVTKGGAIADYSHAVDQELTEQQVLEDTGLGLKIVQDMVRSYNGDIRFTDAPD